MQCAIFQLRDRDDTAKERFASYKSLIEKIGHQPDPKQYELVWIGQISDICQTVQSIEQLLEAIYIRFNNCPPTGYTGRSLSVSDVVAVLTDNQYRYFYTDSFGFIELDKHGNKKGA